MIKTNTTGTMVKSYYDLMIANVLIFASKINSKLSEPKKKMGLQERSSEEAEVSSSWSFRSFLSQDDSSSLLDDCKTCTHQKKMSFWTTLILLSLDIFTIILIIILFKQAHEIHEGNCVRILTKWSLSWKIQIKIIIIFITIVE